MTKKQPTRDAKQLKNGLAEKNSAEKARRKEARESAIETLKRGVMNLADVRDLLIKIEDGVRHGFTPEALATFARATLMDARSNVERSLLELGLLDRELYGYFVSDENRRKIGTIDLDRGHD